MPQGGQRVRECLLRAPFGCSGVAIDWRPRDRAGFDPVTRDPSRGRFGTRVYAELGISAYLSREEVKALLAAPDRTTWSGRRDHALLLTLYNSGARVSEVIALRREQVQLDPAAGPYLELHGKGRKERVVPLWAETARVLRAWLRELGDRGDGVAFPSARGRALSRDGVDHLLHQAVAAAAASCPSLRAKRVSPHVLRHSTAMHLFQAGVDMAVIALWLGHESLETTHVYVEADLATKERALDKLAPMPGVPARYRADDKLLAFLAAL